MVCEYSRVFSFSDSTPQNSTEKRKGSYGTHLPGFVELAIISASLFPEVNELFARRGFPMPKKFRALTERHPAELRAEDGLKKSSVGAALPGSPIRRDVSMGTGQYASCPVFVWLDSLEDNSVASTSKPSLSPGLEVAVPSKVVDNFVTIRCSFEKDQCAACRRDKGT